MKFAQSSLNFLKTGHRDIRIINHEVKKVSEIDFDISEVYRSLEKQHKKFLEGKSKVDGYKKKGKHNLKPAEAFDIYCYDNRDASYKIHQMAYMAGVFRAISIRLYKAGKTSHIIRWGGNWDQDGEIITDQDFDDLCHFEIVKP